MPRIAMMEQIRNATKSWLAIVIVGLLIVSFAMWGVQDVFTASSDDPIAVVGDQEISQEQFAQAYGLQLRQARAQRGGNLTQSQALAMGLHRDTLNTMIRRSVLNQVAGEMGLVTSDSLLQRQIQSNPAFAGPTGQFEQRSYFEALAAAGYRPDFFENEMRYDLTRGQLLGTLISGFYMPPALATAHYEYAFERRELEYFLLPPAAAGEIADPGEETLRAYYDQHTNRYRAPEYRALTLLKLGVSDLADDIDVPEEDIRTLYEIREDSLQVPERREVEQLTFPSRTEAEVALNLLRAGGEFENVGGTYVDLGELAEGEGVDPAVTEAAFALDEPGLAGIVEGALSTSIVRVTSITPGETTSYEEVREELREELALQIAEEEIFAISEDAQDMLAGGAPLNEVGEQLRIPVVTTDAIDRTGETPDGAELADFTRTPGLLDIAFDLAEGEDSGFRDTPDGDFYVVGVNRITPARVKSFDEVRGDVLEDWRREQVDEALAAMADEAAARINEGAEFAAVAEEMGFEVRQPPRALRRGDTSEIFTAALLNTLFTEPAGTAAAGHVQLGASYVVARATNVIPADPDDNAEQVSALRTALEDRVATELVNLYVDEAQNALNVRINEQILNQVVSGVN